MSHGLRRLTIITIILYCCLLPFDRPTQAQQVLIDIGTLGGDVADTQAMNAMGQIVGMSMTTGNREYRAFLWTPDSANATTGTWTDLGHLGDGFSHAYGINNAGVIVGVTNMPENSAGLAPDQAFLWTPVTANAKTGSMQSLGTLGGFSSEARGINDSLQVVGASNWTFTEEHSGEVHAFLWSAGTMVDLGTLGGSESFALAINAHGKAVGASITSDGSLHAFLWTPDSPNGTTGEMQDLGTLGGTYSTAVGMNTAGQIVGFSTLPDDSTLRAFLWTPGGTDGAAGNPQMRDLGSLVGSNSQAFAINDDGWVTGLMEDPPFGNHTFIWIPTASNATTGGMIDLGSLGGSTGTGAAINHARQIAGWSNLAGDEFSHVFVSSPVTARFAQTITFGALPNKAFGDLDFTLSATASSGLPVSFEASGSCEVTGSVVRITGNGTCTITASQVGNDHFESAMPVPQSFDIVGLVNQPQMINFNPIPNKVVGDADFTLTATATSGLPVTFTVTTGDCVITGATVHLTGPGACLITASQPGDTVYAPAPDVRHSFLITSSEATSSLLDIGTLGGVVTEPSAINGYGQIVGSGFDGFNPQVHAAMWKSALPNGTAGMWVNLGRLGGDFSSATSINDTGHVVGVTDMSDANGQRTGRRAFLWTPNRPNGQTGTMVALGTLGGRWSEATGINNARQIVGRSAWTHDPEHDNESRAVLWQDDTMFELGTFGGAESAAIAISSDGKIVGVAQNANGDPRAFLWTPGTPNGTAGTMIDLGTLGGSVVRPAAVNAAGQVVGYSTTEGEAAEHAFLWTAETGMLDLGTLAGYGNSNAYGITDTGMIVGNSQLGISERPFIWTPDTPNGTSGAMADAMTLGGTWARATAINARGQITGYSTINGDQTGRANGFEFLIMHAFVSPATMANAGQTISFDPLADKTFGDADFTIAATASSGLVVTFGAEGDCSVIGTTVHLIRAGSCTILATQAGDGTYSPARYVPQSFNIAKGSQAPVVIGAPSSLAFGNTATLTATGGSGSGTVTFSAGASTGCSVAGDQLSVTNAAGMCAVTATKAGDDNYLAASSSAAPVTLNKASATLALSDLTPAFDGNPKSVTVTTTPPDLTTVTVTYNGSTTPPTTPGSYAVVAALANDNYQATNATGTLIITAVAAAVKKVTLSAASVVGGAGVTGTVTLAAKAPAGGVVLPLSSSNAAVASVSAAVAIPAGATSGSFPVQTQNVSAPQSVAISAGGTTASLTVTPAALVALTLNPKTLVGGGSVTATVTLTGPAPAGGASIALASSHPAASVPALVVVPAGQTSAPFTIVTARVTGNVRATISATYNGVVQKATLTMTR